MDILSLLDIADWVESYEIQDYRQWENGRYYRLKIHLVDESTLFVREYVDETERDYAFHWQDSNNHLLARWDNAPHHRQLLTFPHHKHTPEGVVESLEIVLLDVLEEIRQRISPTANS